MPRSMVTVSSTRSNSAPANERDGSADPERPVKPAGSTCCSNIRGVDLSHTRLAECITATYATSLRMTTSSGSTSKTAGRLPSRVDVRRAVSLPLSRIIATALRQPARQFSEGFNLWTMSRVQWRCARHQRSAGVRPAPTGKPPARITFTIDLRKRDRAVRAVPPSIPVSDSSSRREGLTLRRGRKFLTSFTGCCA